MTQALADQAVRERAATATDTNLVVTAGAGTGKTTLLIDRLMHQLFRPRHRVSLNQIVALTFTNKAASEMKLRLRQRLLRIQDFPWKEGREPEGPTYEATIIRNLQTLYGLTDQQMASVAADSLHHLEHAHIETIHSFASYVLRLFPVEAGVDPSFQEDDGTQFEAHFQREWASWLDRELGHTGVHREAWRGILQSFTLDELETLARSVMEGFVPLPSLSRIQSFEVVPDIVGRWITSLIETGQTLRAAHSNDHKLERMVDAALEVLQGVTIGSPQATSDAESLLNRSIPAQTKSWSDRDYDQARVIVKVAQATQRLIPKPLCEFLDLLVPFVWECQRTYYVAGWLSFNGLLTKTRDLLRDSPRVRRHLKQQFAAVLVDEFQDTDPVQYELIVYLAEGVTQEAPLWSQVQLEPGKLFIVGDPKQSIYAFRRADIEAYDSVVQDLVLGQVPRGEALSLRSNFRSHAGVLDPVNACCRQWFPLQTVKGVQPRYEDLMPIEDASLPSSDEGVQVRLVRVPEEVVDADTATQAEARELSRWLVEEVFDKQQLLVNQKAVFIQPRHVAILFRTLTQLRVYVEAFRRQGLPYVTEGEKHFFERQEIIDCVNVLRMLADPYDREALAGVLRSPLGGCTEDVVANLLREGHVDDWHRKTVSAEVPFIIGVLKGLRQKVLTQTVAEGLDCIFQNTPLLELTAASMDGEQAVANVRKLQTLANDYAVQSHLGFRGVVQQLTQWIHHPPPEAESSLVDDDLHAASSPGVVRFMSIHKAKGLEFPMVILAGLHRGADRTGDSIWVDHDWLTDCPGLRLGSYYSLGGIYLEAKMEARQRAERTRLLYLAMTRAQRRLVLSAGLPTTAGAMSRGMLGMIVNGLGIDPDVLTSSNRHSSHHTLLVGGAPVSCDVVVESKETVGSRSLKPQPWERVDPDNEDPLRWSQRMKGRAEGYGNSLVLTPSSMEKPESFKPMMSDQSARDPVNPEPSPIRDRQALFGTLAHRVLYTWNFQDDPENLPAWIDDVCKRTIPDNWTIGMLDLVSELREMFHTFVCSPSYAILRQAEILGREVPITVPWRNRPSPEAGMKEGTPAVLRGIIDVVYRWKGHIWVADYKTTVVQSEVRDQVVAKYRGQAIAYQLALKRVFEESPIRATIIFLRNGTSVEVNGDHCETDKE